MSTSYTDHETRLRELEEIEHKNWLEAEKLRWEMEESWHTRAPSQRLFKKRFVGKIVPGVGCDVCPRECKVWDLRSMEPEEFEQRFRTAARHTGALEADLRRELWNLELSRLGCIAAADAPRLQPVLEALMSPEEEPIVRLEASFCLWFRKLDPDAVEVFREVRYGKDGDEPVDAGSSE